MLARLAGVLYLLIIVFGLSGELLIRSRLIVSGDAAATAANIIASEGLFRAGFLTDSIMLLCDVALAVLLYVLLRPVSKVISLMAMCFRLAQSAVLAMNLLHYHAAILLLTGGGNAAAFGDVPLNALASFFLDLYSHGYDLGLLLFGMNCLLLGWLVYRSGYLPKFLGLLLSAAAFAYLIGSYVRFLAPEIVDTVAPVYLVSVIAELSLCLWLLIKGVRPGEWNAAVGRS
jgi:hypothetical protein